MPRTADPLAQKQKIVSAAIGLYIDDRANFTIANIARKTRIKKVEIYNFFNSLVNRRILTFPARSSSITIRCA